jgi:hypothetical protein
MLTIHIPTPTDPEEAAAWVTTFIRALPAELRPAGVPSTPTTTSPVTGRPPAEETLEEALDRFRNNWPKYADRFMQVHEGLVEIGYTPEWRGSRTYIAYLYPKTGRHFIEMNSSTVYFSAQLMKDKVIGSGDFVRKAGSVCLDGDEEVEFVLQVARGELS